MDGIKLFSLLSPVSLADFSSEFQAFKRDAIRLETLPAYGVSFEREAYASFQLGEAMPMHYNKEWANTIQSATQRGANFKRVRLVPRKPSEYLSFEICWPYVVNQKAGDVVDFIFEDEFLSGVELATPVLDFWLFDDSVIYPMFYDVRGEFLGAMRCTDGAVISWGKYLLSLLPNSRKNLDWALNEYAPRHNRPR